MMNAQFFVVFETPLGFSAVAAGPGGVRRIVLPMASSHEAYRALLSACRKTSLIQDTAFCVPARIQLEEYFLGQRRLFDFSLDLSSVSPFDLDIYRATAAIPYGATRSYRWVADRAGRPKAYRAVGQALGRNPWPPVFPCHRVIRSDGKLGGFGPGLLSKIGLLALESTGAADETPSTRFRFDGLSKAATVASPQEESWRAP